MSKTINLAEKYSDKVQERFYQDSLTQSSFSKDLDMEFVGVRTVKVYDPDVAPLNDYTRSGSNRYGTPQELTDNIYEFQMKQDKAFYNRVGIINPEFEADAVTAIVKFNHEKTAEAFTEVHNLFDKAKNLGYCEENNIYVRLQNAIVMA